MTGDRSTLYTTLEVMLIVDRERGWWVVTLMIAIPVSALVGFGAGVWFATNLYGG